MNLFKNEIEKLESTITDAAQRYYTDGSSQLSDEQFDELVEKLKNLKPDSPVFTTGWGYQPAEDNTGNKEPHTAGFVGSLDKCRTYDELPKNFRNSDVVESVKLDGISVVLYYKNGKFIKALTRGDGETGINITSKVASIVPDMHLHGFDGAIRGEIIMSYKKFDEYVSIHPELSNPRNTVAGLVNSKDPGEDINYCEILVYQIMKSNQKIDDMYDIVSLLHDMYPENAIAPFGGGRLNSQTFLAEMDVLKDAWYKEYPTDGIVITQDISEDNGFITYDAVAFKFPAESKQSTVKKVHWNMSKTGYYVPRVEIDPIELAGTTVTYCTGFNAEWILINGIGKGAVVEVAKQGEIIPNIIEVVEKSFVNMPTFCPYCKHEFTWKGVQLACTNVNCPNMVEQDVNIWMDLLAPVDGLKQAARDPYLYQIFGEVPTIKELMSLNLNRVKDEVGTSKTAKKVIDMFEKLLSPTIKFQLPTALMALNVPRLGQATSKELAQHPDLIRDIISDEYISVANMSKLEDVVGKATAASIADNKHKFDNLNLISTKLVWNPNPSRINGEVAVTGKLSVPRQQFEKELNDAGYALGNICKRTQFLITDNPDSPTSKNKQAELLGVPKITEAEFRIKHM